MKPKLALWYPVKPFDVSQAWGIYNPAYLQFGFSKHNGIDFHLESDSLIHAPQQMQLSRIDWQPNGGGNMAFFTTMDTWNVGGLDCFVGIVFMHLKVPINYPVGTILNIGDVVGVADNTGFSTGPHTHMSCYRIGTNGERLDTDKETNYTFDPALYWNGYHAVDRNHVNSILQQIVNLLQKFINEHNIHV